MKKSPFGKYSILIKYVISLVDKIKVKQINKAEKKELLEFGNAKVNLTLKIVIEEKEPNENIIVADRRDCWEDSKDCQVCIEANNVSRKLKLYVKLLALIKIVLL